MKRHAAICAPRRADEKKFFVLFLSLSAAALPALIGGCSDEGKTSEASSLTSTSASASSSGAGGAGGEGQGGQGGQGGAASSGCLEPSAYAELFTIEDAALCAVAVYSTDDDIASYTSSPTWGSHGGLLSVAPGAAAGSVELTRWKAPSGATGQLTGQIATIAANIPGSGFLGAQAVDLPFFGWTAVSWTGSAPSGEVILAKGDVVEQRYDVNGFFAAAGIGTEAKGRLLYAGLSRIENPAASKSGLYAADACGSPGQDPRLVPDGDASCAAPSAVALWSDSSGPVAVDSAGNVFAVMVSFVSGDQELRGFEASTIAPGAPATNGDTLFKIPGFGSGLGAIAPEGGEPGIVAFQPADAMATSLDVIGQRYSAAAGKVKAEGAAGALLKLAKAGTFLTITADNQGRLWVGGPQGTGGTLFVVVARPSP